MQVDQYLRPLFLIFNCQTPVQVTIVPAVTFIGVITFICSAIGVKIGSIFGDKYSRRAQIAGGIILILIGVKILLDGLGIL